MSNTLIEDVYHLSNYQIFFCRIITVVMQLNLKRLFNNNSMQVLQFDIL